MVAMITFPLLHRMQSTCNPGETAQIDLLDGGHKDKDVPLSQMLASRSQPEPCPVGTRRQEGHWRNREKSLGGGADSGDAVITSWASGHAGVQTWNTHRSRSQRLLKITGSRSSPTTRLRRRQILGLDAGDVSDRAPVVPAVQHLSGGFQGCLP